MCELAAEFILHDDGYVCGNCGKEYNYILLAILQLDTDPLAADVSMLSCEECFPIMKYPNDVIFKLCHQEE